MISDLRATYNAAFSEEQYQAFIQSIHADWPNQLDFRIAETPVFVPKALGSQLVEACESFIDVMVSPFFKEKTRNAIPPAQYVPNENAHSSFLAIDFAICKDENGELNPQLIELQGFPSIFGFQSYISEQFRKFFPIPENVSNYFGVANQAEYIEVLKKVIVGNENPENVILLEIYPEQQKTRVDFAVTEAFLGVKAVCYTHIKKEGRKLFYESDGRKIAIHRIYNRLIFDDLSNFPDLQTEFNFTDDVDVTWVGHPNWFFRISKYTLPFLQSRYVPETRFVSEYNGVFPEDLKNFVLKPLFSFAGSGVKIHVIPADLTAITDPENYILQRKVTYEPVIQAPDGLVKCEIRMLYVWEDDAPRPRLLTSLSRLSRGEMIGVRFNKDFTWVGGSTCFY
ncbi:MAG: hypothetical protein EAZ32_07930 [Cytophagia bacterium]|nr:MAG: hypothetical protein EAZ46_08310 [Runella sp.]TAG18514.1 MAG: hypothetical protein EAZ38_14620 [Cytophagales bacterium]TAG40033.1 MAG: hypothetical protein EAZ32_07930 [Cytophagia bacterium]TAG79364.1 MAG: hypothetical protein EAZ22_11725 [Cytophagales bacterium]